MVAPILQSSVVQYDTHSPISNASMVQARGATNNPVSSQPSPNPLTEKKMHPFGTRKFFKLARAIPPKQHSDLRLAQSFGDKVILYSSPRADVYRSANPSALPEPGNDAIELLDKFLGAGKVLLISSHRSPHKLEYQPPFLKMDHSKELSEGVEANSVFFLNTDRNELQANARNIPWKVNVIISNNSNKSVMEQVALLHHIRPDLKIYGHASSFNDPHNHKGVIEAFRRVGSILTGQKNVVVRPLSKADSEFIKDITKTNLPAGVAIPALFNEAGELDRAVFEQHYDAARDDAKQRLNYAMTIQANLDLSKVERILLQGQAADIRTRSMISVSAGMSSTRLQDSNRPDPFSILGKVLILGSTGNVGQGILNALAGRVDIDATVRDPAAVAGADHLGSPRHPVRELPLQAYSKDKFSADTVFITASTPRDKGVTNRAGQLLPNLEKVMIPLMAKIPPGAKLIQIITNPCADMSYAAWLLRPDLAGKIVSHSGTDLVRQQAHVAKPKNPDTYFTFGPHSPKQVNVDLHRKMIDKSIATKAENINWRSGGQATTDPTSLSSIYEALNILENKQSSYALPLTAAEAQALQEFISKPGLKDETLNNFVVHEGIAPTLPRKNGEIHWKLLEKARDKVPGFMQGVAAAMAELEFGRTTILTRIVEMAEERRPDPAIAKRLNVQDTQRLQTFLREAASGNEALKKIVVPEGIAPTLPRTNGAIDWGWLAAIRDNLPNFMERLAKVPEELAQGKTMALDGIVSDAEQLRPYPEQYVDSNWILQNRKSLLAILNTPPATTEMQPENAAE